MLAALFSTLLGASLVFYFGTQNFGFTKFVLFHAILASNIAGFLDLTFITQTQNIPALKKIFSASISQTWVTLAVFYFAMLVILGPHQMILSSAGAWLLFPLILSAGVSTLLFGPLQDSIMKIRQRRSK